MPIKILYNTFTESPWFLFAKYKCIWGRSTEARSRPGVWSEDNFLPLVFLKEYKGHYKLCSWPWQWDWRHWKPHSFSCISPALLFLAASPPPTLELPSLEISCQRHRLRNLAWPWKNKLVCTLKTYHTTHTYKVMLQLPPFTKNSLAFFSSYLSDFWG